MMSNTRITFFTFSELLKENQQDVKLPLFPLPPTPKPRLVLTDINQYYLTLSLCLVLVIFNQ